LNKLSFLVEVGERLDFNLNEPLCLLFLVRDVSLRLVEDRSLNLSQFENLVICLGRIHYKISEGKDIRSLRGRTVGNFTVSTNCEDFEVVEVSIKAQLLFQRGSEPLNLAQFDGLKGFLFGFLVCASSKTAACLSMIGVSGVQVPSF